MTKSTLGIGFVILVAIGAGIAYMGWRASTTAKASLCGVCGRVIHDRTRTVAQLGGGSKQNFCCPMCPFTAGRQTGKSVRILRLTDFNSDQPLSPDDAYVVVGSDIHPCLDHEIVVRRDIQPVPIEFDRCSPSVLAFSSPDAAEVFQREHGGEVVSFEDFSKRQ